MVKHSIITLDLSGVLNWATTFMLRLFVPHEFDMISLSTNVIWEREKRGLISYLLA